MKLTRLVAIVILISVGYLAIIFYQKYSNTSRLQQQIAQKNADKVKIFLLKYKKPARIEVQSFVKDKDSKYKEDILDIKNLKISLDKKSNYYIELQLFTDENDPRAPLVVQCRFIDIQSKNLIQEKSLNLFSLSATNY